MFPFAKRVFPLLAYNGSWPPAHRGLLVGFERQPCGEGSVGGPVVGVAGVMGIPFQFIIASLTFGFRRLFSAASGSPKVFPFPGQFTA